MPQHYYLLDTLVEEIYSSGYLREILKQYLNKKQKGHLKSGRLQEVVTNMRISHFERVDCNTVVLFRNSHVIAFRTFGNFKL